MDKKALYNLSYGVFMLATRSGNVVNGCITNTCIQVANNPVRIAISVLNSNYTCDLIKESGIFALIAFLGFLVVMIKDAVKFILTCENVQNVIFISAAIISIIAVMIHGLVDTVFFRPQIQFVFWTMVAVVSSTLKAEAR